MGLGCSPSPPRDTGRSRCCQLSSPLAGKDSVFPLPAHTFLPGGRKRSWLAGSAVCDAARVPLPTSPCPLPWRAGEVPALGGCLPSPLPARPGHPPGHRPHPSEAQRGVRSSVSPTGVPSDKHPGDCTGVTRSRVPAPSRFPRPVFTLCRPAWDPGLAGDSRAGAGDPPSMGWHCPVASFHGRQRTRAVA